MLPINIAKSAENRNRLVMVCCLSFSVFVGPLAPASNNLRCISDTIKDITIYL